MEAGRRISNGERQAVRGLYECEGRASRETREEVRICRGDLNVQVRRARPFERVDAWIIVGAAGLVQRAHSLASREVAGEVRADDGALQDERSCAEAAGTAQIVAWCCRSEHPEVV